MTDTERLSLMQTQYDLDANGCWVWKGRKDPNGYSSIQAHRKYWLLSGRSIPEGHVIRHGLGCSRACYNPDHLCTGTHQDNALDRRRDGTMRTKLTEAQVLEIRSSIGKTQTQLALDYGVSITTVGEIIHRKIWRHLP